MTSKIKYRIGLRILKRLILQKQKNRIKPAFSKSKEILVSWDESQIEKDRKHIQGFLEFLHGQGKKVYRVIYHHTKELEMNPVSKDGEVYHLCKKDFSGLGLPKTLTVKKLIAHKFDYFINLNLDGKLPLKSLAGFTNASCRVGHTREKGFLFYDIMVGNPENPRIENFISDLKTHLTKIV